MLIELFLCVILLVLIGAYYVQREKDLPPGPVPIPILGNLIQVALTNKKEPFLALQTLAKTYGDTMMVRFGPAEMLILSSYEAMKNNLGKEEWSGRIFNDQIASRYRNQRLGMLFLAGDHWKQQRRFTMRHLRDVGYGKQQTMETIIEEELNELTSRLKVTMGDGKKAVICMHNFFNLSVLNVLWTLIAGVRHRHDDAKINTLLEKVNNLFKSGSIGGSGLADMFPVLRKVFPNWSGEAAQLDAYESLHRFLEKSIREHRDNVNYGTSHDFMDIFLQEVDRQKENTDHLFTEDQLIMLCLDLFMAGSETTSNTLSYGILYMILNPSVQKNVYEEIIRNVGHSRHPSLNLRAKLPYTEAVLMEIQRLSNVAPFTPPHEVIEDSHYKGYRIPKHTIVLVNMYSLHMNKEHWGDPETFRPERFLDDQGNVFRDEHFNPFGIGKRICLGESLARMSLFLYFTTLILNFRFETVPGHLNPTTEPVIGFTLSPKPFHAVVTSRDITNGEHDT